MANSYYGGFLGNAGALNDLVYRGEPVGIETLPYYGGGMGVMPLAGGVDLPFGGGGRYKTIQEQYKPGAPKENIPIRVFPQSEPGREGAINVPFRLAQFYPGMQAVGNAGVF